MKISHKFIFVSSFCSALLFNIMTVYAEPYLRSEMGIAQACATYSEHNREVQSRVKVFMYRFVGGYSWKMDELMKYGMETSVSILQPVRDEIGSVLVEYRPFEMDILGVADYIPIKNVNVFMKGGLTYLHQDVSVYGRGFSGSVRTRQVFPKVVIGTGYNVSERVNCNIALENHFRPEGLINNWIFNIEYNFG